MQDQQVRVTFEPQGRAVYVLPGTKIIEAAARAGLTIDTPCGGSATCGKCRVQVTGGVSPPGDEDRKFFTDAQLRKGWRLGCQTALAADAIVRVPEASLFAGHHQILSTSATGSAGEIRPAVRKVYVELSAPTLADDVPDLLRLENKVGPFQADLSLIRLLPGKLRGQDFKGTAVLSDHHLIDFEAGDTTARCHGAAFDIGTTTMVGSLLDLRNGKELSVASRLNPQMSYGDDVLSRIKHAGTSAGGLEELRLSVVSEIAHMIEQMCEEAGVKRDSIYETSFAGNSTMEHLLCGIDPTQLGQVPFVPVYAQGLLTPARDLGIPINAHGLAYVFPIIGGFVGGDTVAGILSTQITAQEGPVLLVDIGTNGEIVLWHEDKLWAASTAAGPAFEGARISCGMRGMRGAIEKVVLDGDAHLGVIGNAPPMGICGSGLIDLAAELLKCGVISPQGRLLPPAELPGELSPGLRQRVRLDGDGRTHFVLVDGGGGKGEVPIALTQRDVRELQLGTGAIRAGIRILLRRVGLSTGDLKGVMIAGGFGSFIRRDNAQRIGLLPAELGHQLIHYVGNASLSGARWVLLSADARKRCEDLARQARHVELSSDPNFQMEFAESMIFPEAAPH